MSALLFHLVRGAPDPVAPFSHAVEADGWVFVTGQMPFTGPGNDSPYPESIEEQTHQVMKNLVTVLEGCHLGLENQAEAGMRHRAVAAQVAIPTVVFLVETRGAHPGIEYLEALFALTAADDLADTGREHVHCRHRPVVVVDAHVERLDLLRVVD